MKLRLVGLAALFLAAIVAANLIVNHNGPWITPYVAFALIGLDLTTRDAFHDQLTGIQRWLAIGALIAAGGLISYLFNQDASKIAEASVIAFVAAGIVDTIVYQALRFTDRDTRVNASNVCAAAVDSVLFLWIAFGVVNGITWVQFVAKVAGGACWLLIFKAARSRALLPRNA